MPSPRCLLLLRLALCAAGLVALASVWADDGAVRPKPQGTAPTINAVYVTTPPVIDGKLDDDCWKQAARLGVEYGTLVGSPESDGRWFQGVLTTSYDLTSERSIGARAIVRGDGVTGYAAYRQVVRRGLDIYVLVGDPRSDRTGFSSRVMVKLIRTL